MANCGAGIEADDVCGGSRDNRCHAALAFGNKARALQDKSLGDILVLKEV